MLTHAPLSTETTTATWTDGVEATFRRRRRTMVRTGSRGRTRRKRPADDPLALAHAASTLWLPRPRAGTSSLSPNRLQYGLRGSRPTEWSRRRSRMETRTW